MDNSPLTPEGVREAVLGGEKFARLGLAPPQLVILTGLDRTHETAYHYLTAAGITHSKIIIDEAFNECDAGYQHYFGQSGLHHILPGYARLLERTQRSSPEYRRPLAGQSLYDHRMQLNHALEHLQDFGAKRVMLFAHSTTLRQLLAMLWGQTLADFYFFHNHFWFPNAGLTAIKGPLRGGLARLLGWDALVYGNEKDFKQNPFAPLTLESLAQRFKDRPFFAYPLLNHIWSQNTSGHSEIFLASLRDAEELIGKIEGHFSKEKYPQVWQAIQFMLSVHARDLKHGGESYVLHPLEVALTLIETLGIDEPELVIAALLHDTHEDHPDPASLDTIETLFGKRVAKIVAAVSNPPKDPVAKTALSKKEQKHRRINDYFLHVRHVIQDSDVLVVKLSDNLNNAQRLVLGSADDPHYDYLANKYIDLIPLYLKALRSNPLLIKKNYAELVALLERLAVELAERAPRWEFYPVIK